ncbi:PREDICTED: uncharacterized protein LOC104825125 [Tarenaya hassleriana]|uniref:uncharacterized protein LOC104825125 n=1 Tax=Tarenaya hassleriana TaxID=28532 RepID=UPI00053C4CDB|nr:PREDICTED: uncharacterized protein LOC104825125 [Tarenaya hassleriana]
MATDMLYAKTQRIVLLIDLDPVLHLPDPNPYLSVVFSAAEKLLSLPRLSSSLFSFKLFFSSLSPLLSSSKLSSLSLASSLSFDLPTPTLPSLSRAFGALKRSNLCSSSSSASTSRGAYVAASMRQIVYDYNWELVVRDPVIGTVLGLADDGFDFVKSNLVVLFSPLSRDMKWVSEFLDVGIEEECLSDLNSFKSKLGGIFNTVNDLFVGRDIHLTWVDVKCEVDSVERSNSGLKLGFLESGIKELGWGFCSTDSIVLCSSAIPFGLIYPAIGVSPKVFSFGEYCRKFRVQKTSLEIIDVNGKPLECKCSELELVYLKTSHRNRSEEFISKANGPKESLQASFVEQFGDGITEINVKAMRICDDLMELDKYTRGTFVVREVLGESGQDQEESEFWADRVLQILARETDGRVIKRPLPIWQILLSFIYREGYSVLVSLSDCNGCSWMGILKPFTFSSAFISVLDNGVSPMTLEQTTCRTKVYPSEHKRKSDKGVLNLQDITWAEFCRSVNNYPDLELEDAYFSKFSNSKKLKFLKCWVKQIKKVSGCSLSVSSSCKPCGEVEADTNEVDNLSEETENSVHSSASKEDIASTGHSNSQTAENERSNFASESSESFFGGLPNKIKQGIESEEVDLAALAERIVNSCIFYFSRRCEKEDNCENGAPVMESMETAYATTVTEELTKLLLKEPKDLVPKHKKKESSPDACEPSSAETAPKSIVREYELQIFFRMEILRSEIGLGTEESMKQKFVKHVCLLLEAIQCKLDGGFFGDWSLDKYVDKTIKARYHHILGEVVKNIYTKMDLLLFTDEEPPDSFLNSEESGQSGKENKHAGEKTHSRENTAECREARRRDEEARKLLGVRERRERARRFASFTSWMPDLQRVWAPKQAKTSKARSEQKQRVSKRKNGDERWTGCDRVCETPVTGSKRSYYNRTNDSVEKEIGAPPSSSVPKALFQDEP